MKQVLLRLSLASIAFIFSSCEDKSDCHGSIAIINNSSKALYADMLLIGYPDTTFFKTNPNPSDDPYQRKVAIGQRNITALAVRGCLEKYTFDTSMVYIFDAKTLETTPWDTIIRHNLYLKRYDLTLADMKNKNWEITYP